MNFIKECLRTESNGIEGFFPLKDKDGKEYSTKRLVHSYTGMLTEVGEFADAIKKSLFYNSELDVTNLKEELGDLLWYISIAMDELETTFEIEQNRVIKKLKARYPEKFSKNKAENRDLEKERKILEKF